MVKIFTWFFGIIGVIILIYVLIVVVRTVFSYGTTAVSNTQNTVSTSSVVIASTTSNVANAVAGFSLLDWVRNSFHPFAYAPMDVTVATDTYVNYGNTGNSYAPRTSYVQYLLSGFGESHDDFDARWGGAPYVAPNQQNQQPTNTLPVGDSKYIKVNSFLTPQVKQDQVVSGLAYYQVYSDRFFPVYVLDGNKGIIGIVKAYVNGSIRADGYIPFRAVLSFTNPTTPTGYLVFKNMYDTDAISAVTIIPIRFNTYEGYSNRMPSLIYGSPRTNTNPLANNCVIGGCNMQLCLEQSDVKNTVTSCEYRPAYACYQRAICERNSQSGRCGWRIDNTLATCLQTKN